MRKFEYHEVKADVLDYSALGATKYDSITIDDLDRWGREGWEVIHAVRESNQIIYVLMKREIQ